MPLRRRRHLPSGCCLCYAKSKKTENENDTAHFNAAKGDSKERIILLRSLTKLWLKSFFFKSLLRGIWNAYDHRALNEHSKNSNGMSLCSYLRQHEEGNVRQKPFQSNQQSTCHSTFHAKRARVSHVSHAHILNMILDTHEYQISSRSQQQETLNISQRKIHIPKIEIIMKFTVVALTSLMAFGSEAFTLQQSNARTSTSLKENACHYVLMWLKQIGSSHGSVLTFRQINIALNNNTIANRFLQILYILLVQLRAFHCLYLQHSISSTLILSSSLLLHLF